jgi:hypothetical protein
VSSGASAVDRQSVAFECWNANVSKNTEAEASHHLRMSASESLNERKLLFELLLRALRANDRTDELHRKAENLFRFASCTYSLSRANIGGFDLRRSCAKSCDGVNGFLVHSVWIGELQLLIERRRKRRNLLAINLPPTLGANNSALASDAEITLTNGHERRFDARSRASFATATRRLHVWTLRRAVVQHASSGSADSFGDAAKRTSRSSGPQIRRPTLVFVNPVAPSPGRGREALCSIHLCR